jgi:hypothetical protein
LPAYFLCQDATGRLRRFAATVERRVDADHLGFHDERRVVAFADTGVIPTVALRPVQRVDLGGTLIDGGHLAHFVQHVLAGFGERFAGRATGGARIVGAVKEFLKVVLDLPAGASRLFGDAVDAVFALVRHVTPPRRAAAVR